MPLPRVTIERTLVHRCPFVNELDVGTIKASWSGDSVELHELAEYLDTFATVGITHETITETICAEIQRLGGTDVYVCTRWLTAGLNVTVEANHYDDI